MASSNAYQRPFTVHHLPLTKEKRSPTALLYSSIIAALGNHEANPSRKSNLAKLLSYLAGVWIFTSIFCVPPPPNNRPLKTTAKAKTIITKITSTATTPALPPPPSPLSPMKRVLLLFVGGLVKLIRGGWKIVITGPRIASIE